MSMSNLSVDGEFRYIVQWFNEWSELQRDDFVYVFVEYLTKDTSGGDVDAGAAGGVYMNGVVNALATSGVQDKPMSLFQCRIKLFRQWSPKWPIEFKAKLQEKINELDPKVGEKIINELKGPHSLHNGDVSVHLNVNGTSGNREDELEHLSSETERLPSTSAPVAVTVAVAANDVVDQTLGVDSDDNHLAEVLRQETPVDDDDQLQLQVAANERNVDTNNMHASSSAVTTIAVNATPPQPQPNDEPVEQVENNVSASVIVSVTAAAGAEVVPVA
ncbi:CG12948 [Drosophila busckii]|uniref:CG12948 n=1 Tax=Drosophila busckii TaxID=30019 RepID=A0A0M4EM19_DROBS|nr:uncharacterized protein LOC108604473 [Drosophila busckii]ALC45464.1 CG12948 [Drosophila busckii]